MAGGGGGAWKVAYADFVTAMMAFFMVMWLTSQKPEVKEAVANYFKDPSGKRLAGTPNSSLVPSSKETTGGKRSRASGKNDETSPTKMTDEGKKTNVGTMILFEANSIDLTDAAKEKLEALLPELKGKAHRIEIRGHALSDRQQDNAISFDALQICYQRSLSTLEFLVKSGIEPNRIRLSQAGNSEPRFSGTEIDAASNARVEVYLLDEAYEPPSQMKQRLISTKNSSEVP
jgi:chemotaxis protein MotB